MIRQKIAIFLLCFGLSSMSLFSQKIFREGYVLKNSGELFEGLIAYSPGKKIPEKCIFKRFDIAVEVTYNADNIKSFGYKNGRKFESVDYKGKKILIETLVSGYLTLYTNRSEYFLRNSGTSRLTPLKGKISWEDERGTKEFNNPEELMRYLAEGTRITVSEKADLNKELLPVVSAYNQKEGSNSVVYNRSVSEKELSTHAWHSNANSNRFGLVTGLNLYSLSLSIEKNFFLPDPELEYCPILGISYERVLSRKTDNLTAQVELLYHNQSFYTFSEVLDYEGRFTKNDAFFEYKAIKLPLMLRYTINDLRVKPFVNAGLAGMFFLQSNYLHINEDENYSRTSIEINEDSKLVFKPYELSAVAGAGIKIRLVNDINLRLEGRFEFGTGIFSTDEVPFKQHSIQNSVLLGIVF